MNTYPEIGWKRKFAIVVVANLIGVGALEFVAGTMRFPTPEAKAARERSMIAACERIEEIRIIEQRELKIATVDTGATH